MTPEVHKLNLQLDEERCLPNNNRLTILTGTSNPCLIERLEKALEQQIDRPVTLFDDHERRVRITHDLRRKDVMIVQSTSPPYVNDHIMELLIMIDAARRGSAGEITVILPYFPYARQDRKEQPKVPIAASLLANLIYHAGARRIVTVDIHSEQSAGFVPIPWDNLEAFWSFKPKIEDLKLNNLVIASPDIGGVRRTTRWAKKLNAEGICVIYKERDIKTQGNSESFFHIGDIDGHDVIIFDDILASGKTIINGGNMLYKNGARRIIGFITHGLFVKDALTRLDDSPIKKVFVTDSVHHREEVLCHPKVEVVTIAPLLAEAITRIHTGESLSTALF